MSSLTGVKRPWLDEPVRTSSDGPQSEGPEDLSTNSERSSFSVSPSPSETATVPGTFGKFARTPDRIMQPLRLESPKAQSSPPTTPDPEVLEHPVLRFRDQLRRFGVGSDPEEDPSCSPGRLDGDRIPSGESEFKSRARSWLRAKKSSRCQFTEIHPTPFDLSTKRQRLSSVSSDGSPTFRLPRTPLSPSTPLIPPMIAPLLDPWNPLLYPLPALYYSSLCANLSAQTFRPQILTHEKPQDAVVPSWETVVSHNNNNNNNNSNNNNSNSNSGGSTKLTVKKEPEDEIRSPTGSNRFTCDDCQKSYSTFAGLSKHKEFHCVNSASGRKEFCCKYCSKSYVSMGALKMHIRTHTLPCKCDICGKAFSRPWLLQGHIRTHTGEKPFECEHCHRAFADRSNLRAHLQTHQEVKKYSCARCSKTFSRMSLLQKHQDSMSCVASRSESSLSSRSPS